MSPRDMCQILGAVLAGCLCVFGSILHPAFTFAGMDFLNLIYPRGLLIQQSLGAGQVPLWNPYEWGGSPLLAAMQGGVLYPFTWLFASFPLPFGQQLATFGHLVLAGYGAGLLCHYLFRSPPAAAAFCGVAYSCGGFVLGRVEQLNVLATFAWTPWLFLSGLHVLSGNNLRASFAVVLTVAVLAGHPQTIAFAAIGFVVFLIGTAMGSWSAKGRRTLNPWGLLSLAGGGAIAGLIAAAQLLPTHELSRLSERVWPYADPFSPFVKLADLAPSLLIPRYYNTVSGTQGRPFGFSEAEVYSGMLTPLLALGGIVVGLGKRQPWAWGLAALILFSFWFALGPAGGLAAVVMELIPFLKQSRGAARMLNCGVLGMCLAAGNGLSLVVLLLQRWYLGGTQRSAWVLWLLLVLDLSLTHRPELGSLLVRIEAIQAKSPIVGSQSMKGATRLYRFMAHDSDYYLDNTAKAVYQRTLRLQPNQGSRTGIPLLDGYEEGLLPMRAQANILRRYNRNLRSGEVDSSLLAILGCSHLLTDYPIDNMPGWTQIARYTARLDYPLTLFRSELPSIRFLSEQDLESIGLSIAELDGAYGEGMSGQPRPGTEWIRGYPRASPGQIVLSHPLQTSSTALRFPQQFVPVGEPGRQGPNATTFTTAQTSGTILCLGFSYPGWKMQVNERPAQSLQPRTGVYSIVNIADLQKPQNTLRMVYHPFSFRFGLFISLASLLVCGCFAIRRIMP